MKLIRFNYDRLWLTLESHKRRFRYRARRCSIIRYLDDCVQLLAELIMHRKTLKSYVEYFSRASNKNLWIDAISSGFKFGTTISEYFTFRFFEKNEQQRARWLPSKIRRYVVSICGN